MQRGTLSIFDAEGYDNTTILSYTLYVLSMERGTLSIVDGEGRLGTMLRVHTQTRHLLRVYFKIAREDTHMSTHLGVYFKVTRERAHTCV